MPEEQVERPAPKPGVIALGVLGLLLGLLFFCTAPWTIAQPFLNKPGGPMGDQPMAEMWEDPVIVAGVIAGGAVNLLAGIALITSSIGLFRLRAWAWKLAVATLTAVLLWSALSTAFYFLVTGPRMEPYIDDYIESAEFEQMPPTVQNWMRFIMKNSSLCGIFCCLPFPVVMLVVLVLPGTRGQFFPKEEPGVPPPLEGSL